MDTLKSYLQENQYIIPSYSLYGGLSGFQDYGILGFRMKQKILSCWRNMFLSENDIFEIETPIIAPYETLKASGHVDRFTDYVVYDSKKNSHRADHLVEEWLSKNNKEEVLKQIDKNDPKALEQIINKFNMLEEENDTLLKVQAQNLMFEINQNFNKDKPDFLRPELATTIFVNFHHYNQFLKRDLPFGISQIGTSFRKEISPKQFIRMRQFTQAEIEYFVNPNDKRHPNFEKIKNVKIPVLSDKMQSTNVDKPFVESLSFLLKNKIISNEVMAYFLGLTFLFAKKIGLDENKIRFRQHQRNEMAHYASECWDLEAFVNNSWLECVGCADRGDYDLKTHSKKNELIFKNRLSEPIKSTINVMNIDKKQIAMQYKQKTTKISDRLNDLAKDVLECKKMSDELDNNNQIVIKLGDEEILLTKNMISFQRKEELKEFDEFYPHTIEPSFGIDRLMLSVFEHNIWRRKEDNQRIVFSVPYIICPFEIALVTLYNRDDMCKLYDELILELKKSDITYYTDTSNVSIGKKYARLDEMGIKFTVTIDTESPKDNKVTIRERDSMKQIRIMANVKDLKEHLSF